MATSSSEDQEDKNLKEIIDELKNLISAMKPVNNKELKKSIGQCYETLNELKTRVTDTSQIIYDWHDYFMCIACLAALRSVDLKTKVGACIVNQNNNVVGIGYNCMPGDYDDHKYPKDGMRPSDKFPNALFDYRKKYLYVVHSAVNAILNKTVASLEGCTIYLTMSFDEDCAHAIIQSGIKTVVYGNFDTNPYRLKQRRQDIKNGRELLNKAGITVVPYESLKEPKVTLTNGKTIYLSDILQHQSQQTHDEQPQPLTSDQFFMAIAMLSKKKQGHHEHDPHSTQGACIVSECGKKVISIGHSGYPDQVNRRAIKSERYLPGNPFIVHAEYNAILAKGAPSLKGCTLYVTKYPCHGCAQVIVQAGISRVIFAKGEPKNDAVPCDITGDCHQNHKLDDSKFECKRHNSFLASKGIFEKTAQHASEQEEKDKQKLDEIKEKISQDSATANALWPLMIDYLEREKSKQMKEGITVKPYKDISEVRVKNVQLIDIDRERSTNNDST